MSCPGIDCLFCSGQKCNICDVADSEVRLRKHVNGLDESCCHDIIDRHIGVDCIVGKLADKFVKLELTGWELEDEIRRTEEAISFKQQPELPKKRRFVKKSRPNNY